MLTNKKLVASYSALTLTILGLVLFNNGCTPSGPRAVLDGARLVREGRADQAVPRLQEAVRLLPKNAQAWNYLGLAWHHAGRPGDAIKAYQQALALDRNLSAARFNLGCLYLDQTNAAAAIAELTTFTALQPNSSAGWAKLGTAQLRLRQLDAAERSFNQALKQDPGLPDAMNGLGMVMAQRRRYAEALNFFNATLRAHADYAPALLNAGIISHQNLNNRAAALQRFREYLSLTPAPPNSAAVRELVAQLDLESRPPLRPPATNAGTSSAGALQRTDAASAPAKSQPVPSTNKPNPSPPPQPASISTPSTLNSNAGLTVTPTPLAPSTTTGLISSNQKPAAVVPPPKNVEVVQVPRDEPLQPVREVPVASLNRTVTPEAVPSNSAPSPSSAASLASPEPSANSATPAPPKPKQKSGLIKKLNPVNWFRSNDSGEKPARHSPEGGRTVPAAPEVTNGNSAVYSSAIVEATVPRATAYRGPRYQYHSFAVPLPGDRAEAERRLTEGVKARERNRLKEAMDAFRQAATADPSFFEAQYNLGVAAFEAGEFAKALQAYEQALVISPDSMKARYNFAVALAKANYPQDAASELERVIAKNPAEPAAHLALANLYARQPGETDKARQHYLKFLELQPQSPQATAIRYWLEAHQ